MDAEEEKTLEPTPEPVFDDPPAMSAEMTDVLERELPRCTRRRAVRRAPRRSRQGGRVVGE